MEEEHNTGCPRMKDWGIDACFRQRLRRAWDADKFGYLSPAGWAGGEQGEQALNSWV